MKRKWLILLIGLVLLSVCAGKLYINNQKELQQKKTNEAERMSVVKLKETFAGIESVKFNIAHNQGIQDGYTMDVSVTSETNDNSSTLRFTYWWKSQIISDIGYTKGTTLTKGVTLEKVNVTYLNGEESEL